MKKSYFILKQSEKDGNFYLAYTLWDGFTKEERQEEFEKICKKHPNEVFSLECEDWNKCWWNDRSNF